MMGVPMISLRNRGWRCLTRCIAVIRLHDRPGYAVGVQDRIASGGTGRVWMTLRAARKRAAYLAEIHKLPVVESL